MRSTRHVFAGPLAFPLVAAGCGAVLAMLSGCSEGRPAFSGVPASLSPTPGDPSVAIRVPDQRDSLAERRKRATAGSVASAHRTD